LPHFHHRNALALLGIAAGLLAAAPAQAQIVGATGFGVPSFSIYGPGHSDGKPRWEGSYASVSSGFSVTKFRGGPTIATPEVGLAMGRNWREGNIVWGVEMAGSYAPMNARWSGPSNPMFSEWNRDFSGVARIKAGVLVTPDVLLYSSVGAAAVHDRFKAAPALGGLSRDEVNIRPDVRAGVLWAATPNLTLGFEVGTQPGPGWGWR
jgi:opacity protein-like surface antigen